MKNLSSIKYLFLFFCNTSICSAQQGVVEIRGTVYAVRVLEKDTLPLKNAVIIFKMQDTVPVKQLTDEQGQFRFLAKVSEKPATLQALSTSKTFNKTRKVYCFTADETVRNISLNEPRTVIADFEFVQFTDCGPRFPEALFKWNSVVPENGNEMIASLVSMMKEYPGMKIVLLGNADRKEKAPASLSKARAKQVYRELLRAGIHKKRLSYKGLGSTSPIVNEQVIEQAATEDEKLRLRKKNANLQVQLIDFGVE